MSSSVLRFQTFRVLCVIRAADKEEQAAEKKAAREARKVGMLSVLLLLRCSCLMKAAKDAEKDAITAAKAEKAAVKAAKTAAKVCSPNSVRRDVHRSRNTGR